MTDNNPDRGAAVVSAPTEAERGTAGLTKALVEWAHEQAALHHRNAHENEHLRTQHIACSSAYLNLAEKVPEAVRTILEREA